MKINDIIKLGRVKYAVTVMNIKDNNETEFDEDIHKRNKSNPFFELLHMAVYLKF